MAQSAKRIVKEEKGMAKFRFQDLEIWQTAIQVADDLFDMITNFQKTLS